MAVAIGAGMLSLALFVPPRPGVAASAGVGLMDEDGWARIGWLQRGNLSVEILARGSERAYTVRRAGEALAQRIDAESLYRHWQIDAGALNADAAAPGPIMMVDPDADALLGH